LHGQSRREITAAALDDIVSDAVASVSPLATAEGVRIEATALGGEIVEVDVRELTRAVTNIIRNAVQHTPAGGRVLLTTTRAEGWAVVSVTDACGGIPAGGLPRLLEPGWRGDSARSGRGMGLGLAIVDEVARAHGGAVTIVGTAPAEGCTVSLRLPANHAVLTDP
ncbi:MAG TPA: HAMP domain-containing histidine kinase, partial [Microbacterium sp.]|nr:HAMP domain-containing histidine kinase [Microbacterium sp.]